MTIRLVLARALHKYEQREKLRGIHISNRGIPGGVRHWFLPSRKGAGGKFIVMIVKVFICLMCYFLNLMYKGCLTCQVYVKSG